MKPLKIIFSSLLIVTTSVLSVNAQTTKYWDIDTIDQAGAGGATPSGTWDTGTTANWNTNANGTGVPTTWTAGDSAVFSAGSDATGSYLITLSGTQSLGALTVEDGTVQLGSGQIDFGATNGSVTVGSGATLNMVGAGGTINGTSGITKNGAGTLLLGNVAQPYSKATGAILTINSGIVEFTATGSTAGNDNALGTVPASAQAAAVTINGGTLRWNGTASHTLSVNRGITIGANGGTIEVVPSNNTGLSLPSAASFTLNGAGTLTKTGAGRLTLNTTSNSFTGKYIIKGGDINVPGDGRFGLVPASATADYFKLDGGGLRVAITSGVTINANRGITLLAGGGTLYSPGAGTTTDILTYNGIIAGSAGGGLTIASTDAPGGGTNDGIVLLGGANTYDGPTTVTQSGTTLRVGASAVIPDTSLLTLNSGTIFDMATSSTNETVKSISGSGTVMLSATSTLTLNNPAGETSTATLNVPNGGKIVKNGSGAITLSGGSGNNNATTGFNGEFVLNSGTLGFGTGTMLGGSNTPTATLTINGGKLANIDNTTKNFNSAMIANLNGDFTVDDSLFATPGTVQFNGGTATIKNSDRTITVSNATLSFLGPVAQDGTDRSLTKAGSGILQLFNSANTYNGSTTISAGQISIDADGTLGTGVGALNLAGGRLTSTASRSVTSNPVPNPINVTADSEITTSSAAATVDLNLSSSTVGGSGKITFRNDGAAGAGLFQPRFTGSGANFTPGPIQVDNGANGTTQLNSFNATGTTQTFAAAISGTGSYKRSASSNGTGGTTVFTAANSYGGGTIVNDGTLLVNNTSGSGTGTGAVTVGSGILATTQVGILGGTGTISGAVTAQEGGTIAPGSGGIGTLTASSNVTMALNSHLAIDLSGASADELFVGGALDLSAAEFLDLTGSLTGTVTIAAYTGTLTGTFDTVNGMPAGYTIDYGTLTNSVIRLVAPVAGLSGDFNSDGKVDASDYATWRKNDGPNASLPNDGGATNQADRYTLWRTNFGNPPGAGSGHGLGGSAVPEPSAIALLVMGLLTIGCRRRG